MRSACSVMEVWSPGKWVGLRFFVDENGQWYVRFGRGHRRRVRARAGGWQRAQLLPSVWRALARDTAAGQMTSEQTTQRKKRHAR